MSTKPTFKVSREALDAVFEDLDLWAKIRDGRLHTTIVSSKDSPSHHYPGAISRIAKHILPDGWHLCTTHRIEHPQSGILHEDAKDIHFLNVILTRP